MTIYKGNIRQKFLIEKLLEESWWAKAELARELSITSTAIEQFLKTWARTIWKQKQYTEAFNNCFETNYSYKTLFSKVSENDKDK